MKKHNNIHNFEELLNAEYGKEGNPQRVSFNAAAKIYYWRNLLKSEREAAQLSQAELAAKINVSTEFIINIEDGDEDIRLTDLLIVLSGLGLDLGLVV